ncbi:MAG: MotA/TolQ/ExbB proton channel family protein [Deltaproteobacteria bacterium]
MNDLQQLIYDIARILLWPVLIAAVVCLVWVLIELGVLLYELWLRFRYRDLDALEVRALRARKAFRDGKPRTAYRYLQENNYSLVVVRFLYDLIRNYQTERLAAKPLKLLQEYEFYTIKRLERTRILVRIGPMLGLMGTLIPLAPALVGLASGDVQQLSDNLVTAFSVTVIGLLIGGLAFLVSIVRDRLYSQDISDMEYLLELLEGSDVRLRSGRRLSRTGVWDTEAQVEYEIAEEDAERTAVITLPQTPDEPLLPVAAPGDGNGGAGGTAARSTPVVAAGPPPSGRPDDGAGLTFDDPSMDWSRDDDPFAGLGPIDPEGTDDPRPRGSGGPSRRR